MTLSQITNYLEDDWGDNALTSRTGASEGYFLHPSDGLVANLGDVQGGDALKGVYRPEWKTRSGSPSASSGVLQLPNGSSTVQSVVTPNRFDTGSYKVDFTLGSSSPSSGGLKINIIALTTSGQYGQTDNGYYIVPSDSGSFNLRKSDGGTYSDIINSSYTVDTNTKTVKGTRDSYGNFELFLNGTSQGTGSDTTFASSKYTFLSNQMDVSIDMDNLVVN